MTDDGTLIAWLDGELDERTAMRLREAIEHDAELADAVRALEASRLPYRAAYAERPAPPVPGALRAQVGDWVRIGAHEAPTPVRERAGRGRTAGRTTGRLAVTACLVASFGAGLAVSRLGAVDTALDGALAGLAGASGTVDPAWVERVADYQSLYVADTVRDVPDGRAAAQRLLAAIELETGMRAGIPDLEALGYEFARAQRLGYEGDPLVQLVYTAPGRTPLALCWMPRGDGASVPLAVGERVGLGTASWAERGRRFVIVADETEDRLRALHGAARATWL